MKRRPPLGDFGWNRDSRLWVPPKPVEKLLRLSGLGPHGAWFLAGGSQSLPICYALRAVIVR